MTLGNNQVYQETKENLMTIGQAIAEVQDSWDELQSGMKTDAISNLANAFGTLGDVIGGTAGELVKLIATMAEQVVQAAINITTLKAEEAAHKEKMTAAAGDAASEAMAAHSAIPFVGVAIGVGMVATIIATLMSLPKFAEGGVVGGNSPDGDKILARLNSGELVLNKNSQRTLLNALNSTSGISGNVKFEISGRNLVGVLNSEADRQHFRV